MRSYRNQTDRVAAAVLDACPTVWLSDARMPQERVEKHISINILYLVRQLDKQGLRPADVDRDEGRDAIRIVADVVLSPLPKLPALLETGAGSRMELRAALTPEWIFVVDAAQRMLTRQIAAARRTP